MITAWWVAVGALVGAALMLSRLSTTIFMSPAGGRLAILTVAAGALIGAALSALASLVWHAARSV